MLRKDMRKELIAHKWLEIANRHTNPTQTLQRLKREANTAINDLALLARKLPDDAQEEIFSYQNMQKLLAPIVTYPIVENKRILHDRVNRITHISYLLVSLGISIISANYRLFVEPDMVLNRATLEKLQNAAEICEAIALKMHYISESSYKAGLVFLFTWNKIITTQRTTPDKVQGDDNRRLIQYLQDELELKVIKNVEIKRKMEFVVCYIDAEDNRSFSCNFRMYEKQNLATQLIVDLQAKTLIDDNKNLIVKKEENNLMVFKNALQD